MITTKQIKKGEIIQRPDDSVHNAYLVINGLLKSYIIDEKGKEHIFMFAPEDWLILDIALFSKAKKAVLFIEAIEDSKIQVLSNTVFENKEQYSSEILSEQIDKLVNRLMSLQHRILLLMSASAIERYDDFLSTYPDIVQRVSQKMIASYLRVTPEALSNLKGRA